jgi:hypothetical protein
MLSTILNRILYAERHAWYFISAVFVIRGKVVVVRLGCKWEMLPPENERVASKIARVHGSLQLSRLKKPVVDDTRVTALVS